MPENRWWWPYYQLSSNLSNLRSSILVAWQLNLSLRQPGRVLIWPTTLAFPNCQTFIGFSRNLDYLPNLLQLIRAIDLLNETASKTAEIDSHVKNIDRSMETLNLRSEVSAFTYPCERASKIRGVTKIFLKDTMVSEVSKQSHFRLCFWFYNLQRNKKMW